MDVDGQGSAGVRLAVTGHRTFAGAAAVAAIVDDVLAGLGPAGCVITSLAEGADRLATQRAQLAGWTHEVVLPLDPADYEADFADAASVAEFRGLLGSATDVHQVPPAPTREAAYLAAGLAVLDGADALLAVWDGAAARGVGGTADIVAAARERALPLTWVRVGRRDSVEPVRIEERWSWKP